MTNKSFLKLDGKWKLFHFNSGDYCINNPAELEKSGLKPITADIPGNVELDLLRIGEIDDPYTGENILKLKNMKPMNGGMKKSLMLLV
jgi:beta-mannosidase